MTENELRAPGSSADQQIKKPQLKRTLAALVLLIATTLITLAFGLIPYDDYASKWVSMSDDGIGTTFGRYGIAYGDFPDITGVHGSENDLDINLDLVISKPEFTAFQVLAFLGQTNDEQPLIIGQWDTYLIVLQGYDFSDKEDLPRLTYNVEEWLDIPFSLRILLNDKRNTLYVNGTPVSVHSPSNYLLEKPDKKIAFGNTLDGKHGWAGTINSFNMVKYNTVTTEVETLVNYDFSEIVNENQIMQDAQDGYALTIPSPGYFPETLFLNNRKVQRLLESSPFDLFINLVGFIPIALAIAYFLKTLSPAIPWWIIVPFTVVGGVGISLIIEFQQQYLPGRNSDLHDLVLNSSGVIAGLFCFFLFRKILSPNSKKPGEIPQEH